MLTLTLDSAVARVSAAVLDGDRILAAEVRDVARGIALLPTMTEAVLAAAGRRPADLGMIAVTVGPGGFTGVRGALSLAHGLALAAGVQVVGVTVPEALEAGLEAPDGRPLWVAIDNRRGRVFLAVASRIVAVSLDSLPLPEGPVALAGDAAEAVAARLVARGADVVTTGALLPEPLGIARAAFDRLRGALPPLAAQPLYVDPPEARVPKAGLRPAPAG
ncbi:MAG: tRNA (adenosine(37)-N6)-threonylcarbamoyltransferase complex dimerization subunit type 1 TsaB [Acetobacteraceae bacterium]